ncbi:MAG TPA: glycosyltransferase family 9 protein [Pyrinomonadaceae bacterium]|jgi:lipopolysaccharide heptosyltransferase II|nr:glycosyltransferase family 9 protein [Pyrinomonadaceae bacterium]
MKSLRENPEPGRPHVFASAVSEARERGDPQPLGPARWDWTEVRRVLVVRLRSIGDTVLATPALHALRRFLPGARIDVLLEDWVAPVLDGFADADAVITIERASARSRARAAREMRAARYDVAFNLHGGTTATLLTRASGATHRVGYSDYRYSRLHNHTAPSPVELWGRTSLHSVEQQLALLGWTGVPVSDRPPTRLAVTGAAASSIETRLSAVGLEQAMPFALIHPAAAFQTKQWATTHFARVAEYLHGRKLACVAVAAPGEACITGDLLRESVVPVNAFTDLSLPEVTALAARASLFVGNDSGIAHIAAAVRTPSVVVFGSSNITHWRPWKSERAEIVREEMPCQPCPGYSCAEFDQPECIRRVPVERVIEAINRVMSDE